MGLSITYTPAATPQFRRWQIQWILKLRPPSKTAAQKPSACSAVHPSNWPFGKRALSQQAFFAPLSHRNSEDIFFHFHNISHPGRITSRRMVCLGRASHRHHHLVASLPPLPVGEDSSPHAPAAAASPHPAVTFFSSPH